MNPRKTVLTALCTIALLLPASEAAAAPKPVLKMVGINLPTHFVPGGKGALFFVATNLGSAPTSGEIALTQTLPDELKPTGTESAVNDPFSPDPSCKITGQAVTCKVDGPLAPGRQLEVRVFVKVDPLAAKGPLPVTATIEGGGALPKTIDATTTISSTPAAFDLLPPNEGGPTSPITLEDGLPATGAGSHPYQLTSTVGFPTEAPGGFIIGADNPRDIVVEFPRGLAANPASTPVLCTEAELSTMWTPGCPRASQVGTITVITFEAGGLKAPTAPLYNMVPPPGTPALLGFDAASVGVFIHLSGEVRSEGDYGISGGTRDALSLPFHPVFGARVELWGKPSDAVHDQVRGSCVISESKDPEESICPTERLDTALLTTPDTCPGQPFETGFRANSWEQPGVFVEEDIENADIDGNPVALQGCEALEFEPTIKAQPTTAMIDSPSGFEFALHQPQDPDFDAKPVTNLKDVTLALPEGLVVNPAAGQGQQACSAAQIGLNTLVGQSPIHFKKAPASCPNASKIGTVEVQTPLLAEVDASKTQIQLDPEGHPIPRTLMGSVYLAKPFDNPFGSLLAIYLDIEDPLSGTIAKFAAKVSADPATGRLTNTLLEGPDLPIEDVTVKLFDGPRASLRTPPTCETYTTTAELTPWASPDVPAVQESDSFALSASPDGGPCPATAPAAPNKPAFAAGTLAPIAGAYSPFVMKVSREDGSQPINGFEATLPKGLVAKLAGIPYCSEAQIAQAQSRSRPEEGIIEQQSPSCPAASEVGSIIAAAGAGPTPLNTTGRVYLAGPYKGAPLSFAIITPAIAGPFDLGTVVIRAATYIDPETAIVRAVSDPLPTILEGIPLDLRSAYLKMGRPQFTLNPTSCEPKSITATATSVFGQSAALTSYFQVGSCAALPFKPKVSFKLKGKTKRTGHPALRAVVDFKVGQANISRAAVTLPPSEFLDQAHIGTVCTRVQFAAKQCPPRAIYGFAKATTPLLDKPLEGPVYLRSSSHELPDLVVALAGQVEVVLAGRVDSFDGGIRNTFETAPDAPVSRFILEMKGGRKGLLQNSENLCKKPSYATVKLTAQNGKTHNFRSLMKNDCKGKGGKGKGGGKRR